MGDMADMVNDDTPGDLMVTPHNVVDLVRSKKKKQTWQTPDDFLSILTRVWHIAVDPCANEDRQFADYNFTKADDGLEQDWLYHADTDLVYLNPPYDKLGPWVQKCIFEGKRGTEMLFLGPSRTGTNYHFDCWNNAAAVCFLKGRLTFYGAKAPSFFDSIVWYWGPQPYLFCDVFEPHGIVQKLGR